jgi:hypothetical protein
MADEKTRVEQYRDPTRQAQLVRGHPDILHNADWQNRIDDLNDQAAKLVKQMTRDEREEAGIRHMPKKARRSGRLDDPEATRGAYGNRQGTTRSGNI